MPTTTDRARSSSGLGLFCCGMGVIAAATVLNIAHDRLSGTGIETLPPFLANMYEMSGKLGVTVTLVTAGLSIILFGFVNERNRRTQRSSERSTNPLASGPCLYTSSDDEEQEVSSSGTVVLRTRKYLSPQSALYGTTGFPSPRKPS